MLTTFAKFVMDRPVHFFVAFLIVRELISRLT